MGYLTLTRFTTLLSALLIALAIPAIANASGDDVIRDCARDGDLDKDYSDEELEDAEQNMPSDIDQYSDCRDVIRQAQAGGRGADGTSDSGNTGGTSAGGSGGGDGGSPYRGSVTGDDVNGSAGGAPSDINELDVRKDQAQSGTEPATSAELAAGADAGNDDGGLPTAALVAIALLGIAAIGGGAYLLRDYLPSGLTSRLPGASR